MSRQARADADRPYQAYVHDVGKTGAKTGRTMPTNVPRVGPDGIESIEDFFRSPLASGSRALPATSFAALADSPLGGGGGLDLSGRSEGDLAVEEALARDEHMGEVGSDSVEGTPSRYFRPKAFKSAPFPTTAARAPALTPPPAGESYAGLPSPSPTRGGRASTSTSAAAARHSVGSSRRTGGAGNVSILSRASPDDDDDDDVEQARLTQGSPVSRASNAGGGRPSYAPSRAQTSPGDYSPVARSRGRPSMAPSRAPTSPGDDEGLGAVGDQTVEFDVSRGDDDDEAMDVGFDDAGQADWGGGQPSSDGNERFDDGFPAHDDGAAAEEDEEEEEEVAPVRAKGKGKRPRVADPNDDDDEDEADDGGRPAYDDDEAPAAEDLLPADEDDDAPAEEDDDEDGSARLKGRKPKPKPKAAKREKAAAGAEQSRGRVARAPKIAPQPHIVRLPDSDQTSDDDDAGGGRRSKRQRFRPLEYWRGEKLIFGRTTTGRKQACPIVKAVQELPHEAVVPFTQRKRARKGTPAGGAAAATAKGAGKRGKRSATVDEEPAEPEEAGWDRDTLEHGVVFDYTTKQEIERRIAFPAHLLEYRTMSSDPNGFKFQKVFGDASFVAAGMLEIPVDGEKPSKPTKDNTYLFYVIEGAVNVKIHRTSFTMAVGGQFMVPRGNQYSIHTISRRPAKLFFAQARRMASDEEDVPAVLTASQAPPAGAKVAGRAGAGGAKKR